MRKAFFGICRIFQNYFRNIAASILIHLILVFPLPHFYLMAFCLLSALRLWNFNFTNGGAIAMTQLDLIYKTEEIQDSKEQFQEQIKKLESGIDRSWCSPSKATEIIGADIGQGLMHLHYYYAKRSEKMPIKKVPERFLTLKPESLFVIEAAHLSTPQTEKSLAQPFTADELISIYQTCESRKIDLRLFPHGHTRKARDWVAVNFPESKVEVGKSTDENDAIGLAWYVAKRNGIALAKPRQQFVASSERLYGKAVIEQSNRILNAARVIGYDGQIFSEVEKIACHVLKMSERFLLNLEGAKPRPYPNFINKKVAFGIASLVATEIPAGVPLFYTYRGTIPGKNFWMRSVLRFSSFHHGGGVARSNNCWHTFRPYLVKFSQSDACRDERAIFKQGNKYVPFSSIDEQADKVRRLAWQEIRYQMKNGYQSAIEYLTENERGLFRPFEILTEQTQ